MRKQNNGLDNYSLIATAYTVIIVATIFLLIGVFLSAILLSIIYYFWIAFIILPFGLVFIAIFYAIATLILQICHNLHIVRENSEKLVALELALAKNNEDDLKKEITEIELLQGQTSYNDIEV